MRCSVPSSLASCIFVLVAIVVPTAARPSSIWDVDIFTGPAPPPDHGPPLSAGALRDRSKLKYEVIGIAGAYIVWLILTFLLLLFVGKKLRHRVQTSNRTLSMEILEPASSAPSARMGVELPLKSPGKMASLRSWASGGRSHARKQSNISVSTIDEKILEADRTRNMDEMAKLYAAVMAHDEERSQNSRGSGQTSPRSPRYASQNNAPPTPRSPYGLPPTPISPSYQVHISGPASPKSPRYPPEFQHLRNDGSKASDHGTVPGALPTAYPLAPAPADTTPSLRTTSQTSSRKPKVSPLSLVSGRGDSADQTKKRPSNISIRGQPISQPIGSASLSQASIYTDHGTASPRVYNPGPPPPTPGKTGPEFEYHESDRTRPRGPLSLRSAAASNSSQSLPFRQLYNESLRSAPPTKTTFLDRRETMLGLHPKTGVPHTPYSPYMPFTPMTPVTPRSLVTKKEMKRNKKQEGLKVLSEDDLVLSDDDLWSPMK